MQRLRLNSVRMLGIFTSLLSSHQAMALVLEEGSIRITNSAPTSSLELSPALLIDGQWQFLQKPTDCSQNQNQLRCLFNNQGTLTLTINGSQVDTLFQASRDLVLGAHSLQGKMILPGAVGWLSNGFQSWSQTGVITIKEEPKLAEFKEALLLEGEDEVYRKGMELSWWYTFAGSDQLSFVAGASTAHTFKSYVQLFRPKGSTSLSVRLTSGGQEAKALKAGEVMQGERWFISLQPTLQNQLDGYAASLKSRRSQFKILPITGWNSWYDLWDDVKEQEIIDNSRMISEIWRPRLPDPKYPILITLDDGWQKKWGDWYPNEKFPLGINGLVKQVQSHGNQMGIWLAPLLAHPDSEVVAQHPDWFVRGAVYLNPMRVSMRILDVTHPTAAEHLQATLRLLKETGVKALKLDFLFGGAMEAQRHKAMTGMEAYHMAMKLIREAAGDEMTIIAVGAPPLATMEYADVWRVGGDIAFKPFVFGLPKPGPSFIANQARSLAGRLPFCKVTLCDADPVLLRALSQETIEAEAWIVAAAGGALILSDHLPRLDPLRRSWALDPQKIRIGLSGEPARLQSYYPSKIPTDLKSMKDHFFQASQEVPVIWIMPDGTRVGINMSDSNVSLGATLIPKFSSRILP